MNNQVMQQGWVRQPTTQTTIGWIHIHAGAKKKKKGRQDGETKNSKWRNKAIPTKDICRFNKVRQSNGFYNILFGRCTIFSLPE
jgi:hypothetical protein